MVSPKKYLVNEWQAFKKYFIFIATFFESQQWRLIPIEKLCYVLRILQYKEYKESFSLLVDITKHL